MPGSWTTPSCVWQAALIKLDMRPFFIPLYCFAARVRQKAEQKETSGEMKSVSLEKTSDVPQALSSKERLKELHESAMSALIQGPEGMPIWRLYNEVRKLPIPKGMRAQHLEARIGLAVAKRIRPSLTVRELGKLHNLRKRHGHEEKFEDFEALLHRSLGSVRLTAHGYRAENFGDMDHHPIWKMVHNHIKFFGEKKYETFLNSGTLLGVVRDKKLIDHDDDIDLAVVLKAGSTEDAAQEWKSLTSAIREEGLLDEAAFTKPEVVKLRPINNVQIDLFPCWVANDKVYVYPHTKGNLSKSDLLPLQTCPVSGAPIPASPEKMLAVNYGANWREPDPYFKFHFRKARRDFASFLELLG